MKPAAPVTKTVDIGLNEQAARGETHDLGDFSKHAKEYPYIFTGVCTLPFERNVVLSDRPAKISGDSRFDGVMNCHKTKRPPPALEVDFYNSATPDNQP